MPSNKRFWFISCVKYYYVLYCTLNEDARILLLTEIQLKVKAFQLLIPPSFRLEYELWKVWDYFCISQFYTLLGRLLVDSLTALVVQAGVVGASVGSLLT